MTSFLNFFKKKSKEPPFNLNHPDLAPNIEFAFSCKGRKYYKFVKDFQMPVGRYKYAEAYLYEAELRMDLKRLNQYCDALLKELDGAAGQIRITHLSKIVWAIQSRCKLAFSPETIERLASAIYFDEHEDLSDLSEEYAQKKIEFWRKHQFVGFFLTRPLIDLLSLNGISEDSLPHYLNQIKQAEEMINDLTFDQEKPYLPNILKNVNTV